MPLYELKVYEDDGEITYSAHQSLEANGYQLRDTFEHEGRRLRIFDIGEADPPYERRLVCDVWGVTDWETARAFAAQRPPKVDVSAEAAERISNKGGTLYLWEEPVGEAWLTDRASFDWPFGIQFETFKAAGVEILIASDVELPQLPSITRSVVPPLKLHIEWDGKPWGARGRFE